ncbi:hypothetical protein [Fodinicurvata sp. EGI_FJ10296]|uniref:hypothetical protein n=1 Tax=Fodinicurvata sp. EGI_FJ10296 TaxID=3231908 RepID=UPI003456E61C
MRRTKKLGMLAGASVAALGLALAAAPATAFDEVGWGWDAEVTTNVDLDWSFNNEFDPTELDNLGMVEDLQIFVGSVDAESKVSDVENNQPMGEGEGDPGIIEFAVDWDAYGDFDFQWHGDETITGGAKLKFTNDGVSLVSGETETTLQCSDTGPNDTECTNDGNTFVVAVDLSEFEIGDVVPLEALGAGAELPETVSAATAIANNASVDAEFTDTHDGGGILLHEGQFAFDVPGYIDEDAKDDAEALTGVYSQLNSLNSGLVISGLATSATLLDLLEHSEVEAESDVDDVLNSSVDSAATAVANNFSGEMMAEDSSALIGDVTQFALANVDAESNVDDVWLHNYTNLGNLDRPIVNSVATAVGNNKSISITVGDIDPTGDN